MKTAVASWAPSLNIIIIIIINNASARNPGQTESQVDPSFQLESTCYSVEPGLKGTEKTTLRWV